jgi:hypothetical protein
VTKKREFNSGRAHYAKDITKKIGGALAPVVGVKGFYDLPAYF